MAIRRERDWGDRGPLPDDGIVVADDGEARRIVTAARRAGEPVPPLGLLGGDLCRTLGGRGDRSRLRSETATRATVDLGAVLLDGRMHWFVAHLVARRRWWRGQVYAAMNAQWLGTWNVAPRAHPGDGRLETFDAALSLGDRLKARSRLSDGSHLPHPDIVCRSAAAAQVDLDPPTPVWLDGGLVDTASTLSVRVEPEALLVVV